MQDYDKYYTKNSIVKLCINAIKNFVNISNDDLIIEPSAGNGAFIDDIKSLSNHYLFYDIKPEHPEIITQDYLSLNYTELKNKYENIHIIGNPPFGRQSSIAIKFIKFSSIFSNSISFILPKSFKKNSLKNKIPTLFHLIHEFDLPTHSFLFNHTEYNVPCIFQIWTKYNFHRIISQKLEPINFIFVSKLDNPHIAFRRVGVNAGNIDKITHNKNTQSHYFIKFLNNHPTDYIIQQLSTIIFTFDNTVGAKSISKQELISYFNPILAKI